MTVGFFFAMAWKSAPVGEAPQRPLQAGSARSRIDFGSLVTACLKTSRPSMCSSEASRSYNPPALASGTTQSAVSRIQPCAGAGKKLNLETAITANVAIT